MSKKYPDSWLRQATSSHAAGVALKDLPAPSAPKKRTNEEFKLQYALVDWWSTYCKTVNVPEFLLWHTPNSAVYGGSRDQREKMGAMLKRLGQRSGCPDLFCCVPKWCDPDKEYVQFHGLFIELKSAKGVVSPEQTCFHAALQQQGYAVHVVRTLEDGKRVIQEYLS